MLPDKVTKTNIGVGAGFVLQLVGLLGTFAILAGCGLSDASQKRAQKSADSGDLSSWSSARSRSARLGPAAGARLQGFRFNREIA